MVYASNTTHAISLFYTVVLDAFTGVLSNRDYLLVVSLYKVLLPGTDLGTKSNLFLIYSLNQYCND